LSPSEALSYTPSIAEKGHTMSGTARLLLIIVLLVLLLGMLPTWPYSSGWGYYPSGGLGLILIIVILLVVLDKL
jgi:hypothetical protein